jgi:hypothetical protein
LAPKAAKIESPPITPETLNLRLNPLCEKGFAEDVETPGLPIFVTPNLRHSAMRRVRGARPLVTLAVMETIQGKLILMERRDAHAIRSRLPGRLSVHK